MSSVHLNAEPRAIYSLPPPEELRRIAERQDAKAAEIRAIRQQEREKGGRQLSDEDGTDARRREAATVIQKNYRSYRTRRELRGYGLDPTTRWIEAVKEAKYRSSTRPMSREERIAKTLSSERQVRDRWRRVRMIAHHAGSDDTSSSSDVEAGATNEAEREKLRKRKKAQKLEREKHARVMGLQYFLEMVDHKHRYGSNLRRYHAVWQTEDTNENFFYWLDYGGGKEVDLEDRPRKRLDTEQVRYLSREERQRYLVNIKDGKFCWAKNGQPVTTSADFRDSINGIVPVHDDTPTWREVTTGMAPEPSPQGSDSSSLSSVSVDSLDGGGGDGSSSPKDKGMQSYVNKLLNRTPQRDTTAPNPKPKRKKSKWIYVADTSFRLFVGIKQSGAFQHSSFLRGARVSAAGQIKIKNGQIRNITPLSGHYAPPRRNFRDFIHNLQDAGADLSRLNTSRSYAVLLGLEGYIGAKRQYRAAEQGMRDMVVPGAKRERELATQDSSQSAAKERQIAEQQEKERRKNSFHRRLIGKLRLGEKAEESAEAK